MAIKNIKNYLSPVQFFNFIKTLLKKRKLIFSMAKEDFRNDYLESYFGLFWAVAQPAAYVLTIWFIFSMGFRGGGKGGEHPFVLYLVSGFIFWTFFSSSVSSFEARRIREIRSPLRVIILTFLLIPGRSTPTSSV